MTATAAVKIEKTAYAGWPNCYRVTNGEVVAVKAIFSQPGTYVLRVIGSDGMLRTANNLTITVNQPASTEGR